MRRTSRKNEIRGMSGIRLALIFMAIVVAGCGGKEEAEAEKEATAPYPAGLSAESTPQEVAAALIRALDAKDKATLMGLAAMKAATQKIDAIYQKRGKESPFKPEANAGIAATGWLATYSFVQTGKTEVQGAQVAGDAATVTAAATGADGTPRQLKIKLVREDGLWKVLPGIDTE